MSKTLTYSRPQTSLQRRGSLRLEVDPVSYEDLLIAKYLEELKRAPPFTKRDAQVEKSPYLQKLAHTHVVPMQISRPPSAAQIGGGFGMSRGRGSRPVSAKPFSATSGGWDSDHEGRRQKGRTGMKSHFTSPTHNNWGTDNELDGGTYATNEKSGRQRIDPRFIGDPNFGDSASPRDGKRPRPLSAPLYKRPYTCSSRPVSAKSVSYTRKARSLYRQKAQTVVVTAYKNGSRDIYARVAAPNLKMLLEACTDRLGLNTAARRIFLEDGQEVLDEKDLRRDDSVYISTGEAFVDPEKGLKLTFDASQKSQWTLGGLVCPQPDKKKSPKTKLSKRFRSLLEQSKRRVLVFQNGSGSHSAEIVTDPKKLENFLAACTAKLDLGSCGRMLYDWEGNEVTDLLEEAPVLPQCLQTWSTPVLGPLWLSKGEGFSPKGVTDFLTGLINYTKAKVKEAKNYRKQLELAQDDDNKDQVQIVAILSMSPKEIKDNITMADKDIKDFSDALNCLKNQKEKLQDQAEEEERNGSNFTMKHIQKYEIDHKLVGKKGMRLKIHENGTCNEPTVIYFNLQRASKGGEDAKQLMCRLLDQCSSITALAYPKKNPAIHPVAKKLFTSSGKEIKSVKELNYDDELWLSFGDSWKDPLTYALALQLDKVVAIDIDNAKKALREQLLTEDTKEEDSLKGGKWELVNGLPEDLPKRVISEPEKESMKNLLASNEISIDNNCFIRHKEKPAVVLYGEVVVNKKAAKSDEVWPPESQIWVLTKDGYCHCKAMPQFVLGLTARKVKTQLQRPGKSEDIPVEGSVVAVQKKDGNDPGQQWEFTRDGYICSRVKGSPDQVLTYLGARHGEDESQVINEENGMPSGERIYLAACAKLNPSRPAKSQRWALKQERFDKLGQWRHTEAENPEWHRQALSWPTCKDGSVNKKYNWPMEGYLLPNAPPLKNSPTDKSYGDAPLRLQVLKNGIKDAEKAVCVVAPDLALMKKGVHSQTGNGQAAHSHSGSSHNHVKSGKGSIQDKAMTEAADAESINDTMLHCDPDQTVLKLEFNMFLDRCTSLLDLPFPARRLFDEAGLEHFNLRSLKRDQLVTVTCGEPWSDPKLSKAEQQRRYLLANLAADVAQIQGYVGFRNPKNLVLEIEGRMIVGSKLVIGESFLLGKAASSSIQESRDQNETTALQPADEKIQTDGSAHQLAHQKSEGRLTRLKWPWERLYNCGDDSLDLVEESEQQRPKRRTKGIESLAELQRFVYEDGFLAMEADKSLVLGISHEVGGQNANVVLVRKNLDDILQRWTFKENGLIQAKHNANLVLTATMKTQNTAIGGTASLIGCVVAVQCKKTVQFGRANQRWQFDDSNGLVYAFSADLHDKEITAANRANVCTNAVLGKTEIDQIGYIVELPEKIGSDQKILVCSSCARAMRGRYRLKKLDRSVDFACAMGSAKEFGLQPIGSFRCLNGKVDLTTYEAEHTLQHWQRELERLRQEASVHTIAKEISAANIPVAIKVLAYKNGDAKRRVGELIIGSSVSGILHQCTNRLQLSQAARRLYTTDGKQILNIDDLIEWAKETYAHELTLKTQENVDAKNDDSGDREQERSSEDDPNNGKQFCHVGNDSSTVGKFVDDEKNVLIIPNPNSPIQTHGNLVEWKIYAVKPGRVGLSVLRPTDDQLTYTLAYQTVCEVVDGELDIDISGQPFQVQSGDVIGFEIKDHGMIPYEVDSTNDTPFLYSALLNDLRIGERITLQISPETGSRQYNLQAKIVADEKPKEIQVQNKEKTAANGKRTVKFKHGSKVERPYVDPVLRYPIEVFVSCGENFSKPEKMDLQHRGHLANMSRQLEKEKHVLRMMQGRRIDEQKPSMLKPTQNPDQPVLVEGSWQEPTVQEKDKHNIVHHLQVHLQTMKANQKPKGVKTAKIDPTGRLYMQPNMKRVLIFPNGEKVELAQYVWGESVLQLLDNSTTRLNLSKPARHLFTMDGDLVTNFDQIERDHILCVSSNKKFLRPQESQQLIEVKANWARTYKTLGPGGTDIIVETTKKKPVIVNPFTPVVDDVRIEDDND